MICYERTIFRNELNFFAYELIYFAYENIDSKKEEDKENEGFNQSNPLKPCIGP